MVYAMSKKFLLKMISDRICMTKLYSMVNRWQGINQHPLPPNTTKVLMTFSKERKKIRQFLNTYILKTKKNGKNINKNKAERQNSFHVSSSTLRQIENILMEIPFNINRNLFQFFCFVFFFLVLKRYFKQDLFNLYDWF